MGALIKFAIARDARTSEVSEGDSVYSGAGLGYQPVEMSDMSLDMCAHNDTTR